MGTINRLQLHHDRTILDAIKDIAKKSHRRLRSVSPTKSRGRRGTLPDEWTREAGLGVGAAGGEGATKLSVLG